MLLGYTIDGNDGTIQIHGNTGRQWIPVSQHMEYDGLRISQHSCKKHVYVKMRDTLYYGWRHGREPLEIIHLDPEDMIICEITGRPWGITLHENGRESTLTLIDTECVSFPIGEYLSEPLVSDKYRTYIASDGDSKLFHPGFQYVDCCTDSAMRPSCGVATDGVIWTVCRDRAYPSKTSIMTRRDLREAEPAIVPGVEMSDKWPVASIGDTLLLNATLGTHFTFDTRNLAMYEYGLDGVNIFGYQS